MELFRADIKQVVSKVSRIDVKELDDHLLIREELGIDSLMAMEILYTCERLLKLKIDEALVSNIQTVGDFLDLLVSIKRSKVA
jgi:acyl carrier protein